MWEGKELHRRGCSTTHNLPESRENDRKYEEGGKIDERMKWRGRKGSPVLEDGGVELCQLHFPPSSIPRRLLRLSWHRRLHRLSLRVRPLVAIAATYCVAGRELLYTPSTPSSPTSRELSALCSLPRPRSPQAPTPHLKPCAKFSRCFCVAPRSRRAASAEPHLKLSAESIRPFTRSHHREDS